jgi:hypothetical protein
VFLGPFGQELKVLIVARYAVKTGLVNVRGQHIRYLPGPLVIVFGFHSRARRWASAI